MTQKTRTIYLLLLLLLTMGLSIDCKKRLIDYRNKYTGNWNFHSMTVRCPGASGNVCDTVITDHVGKISYQRTDERDILSIEHAPNYVQRYTVNKEGIFTDCAVVGKFNNEKTVDFIWTTKMSCGGGHSNFSYNVSGTKE